MAMRRDGDVQADLIVLWSDIPRSPGHAFYDKLQKLLVDAGFDRFVEEACQAYYAARMGAPSVPPGRYFRMLLIGYFEGIHSERGIVWRCSDSLSLREFLRLTTREKVPDHSWMSKTRSRLPHEVHDQIFAWVLGLVADHELVKAERIGVDGSMMEANAALRTIVRRDTGETYREMLTRMAHDSGIETPTADDLVRLDRKRTGKKLSNTDWESPVDPDAKVARMKYGSTRLGYKPEHAVDLDTGVIVAAPIHPADKGDTNALEATLEAAARNLATVDMAPAPDTPCDLVTDKGYHSREGLKALANGPWKTRISEPLPAKGILRWHGDEEAQKAVYANRARLKSRIGRKTMRKRGEMVERSFAHVLDRGGMRRAWLRGRENLHKRYLIHVAGFNLGILMRALFGWQRLSAGEGTKGARLHDWAYCELADLDADEYDEAKSGIWTRGLLIRRNISNGDLAFFTTWCPAGTGIQTLVAVEGQRWAIEDSFETSKNELGLDHNETRSWHGWHRHVSLVMLAFAMMAVIRYRANDMAPPKRPRIRTTRT